MDLDDFTWGIKRLERFYNKKLNQDQEDEYYQRIKSIPQEIFIKAIDDVIDTEKFFPTPGAFKIYWYQWQVTNPDRIDRDVTYCSDCHGEGILYFSIKPKGATFDREYDYMCRCGKCENWKGDVGSWAPKRRKAELEAKGLNIIPWITWDQSQEIERDIKSQVPF